MANISSAQKVARAAERKRRVNQPVRSKVKTLIGQAESLIASGEREAAAEIVKKTVATLDGARTKGVLHRNNVARRKSRLVRKLNTALKAPAASEPQKSEEKKEKQA